MKDDSHKVKMTVNIAGEHLLLTVPFDRQDLVRDTENCVADLFDSWKQRFPRRSDKELLAMIAYQFASYYLELGQQVRNAAQTVSQAAADLQDLAQAD